MGRNSSPPALDHAPFTIDEFKFGEAEERQDPDFLSPNRFSASYLGDDD
jgi:hypothetical protein